MELKEKTTMKINLKHVCSLTGLSAKTARKIFPVTIKGVSRDKYQLSHVLEYLKIQRDKYGKMVAKCEFLARAEEIL